jgi:hypothetical protein
MVFNATFNNISVISWRSVLLVQSDYRESEMKKIDWHDYKKMAEDKEMIGMMCYHILQ